MRVGDVIHIRGHTTDFSQRIESLEVNHPPVTEVGPSDDFGLKVVEHAREHDIVYKVQQQHHWPDPGWARPSEERQHQPSVIHFSICRQDQPQKSS